MLRRVREGVRALGVVGEEGAELRVTLLHGLPALAEHVELRLPRGGGLSDARRWEPIGLGECVELTRAGRGLVGVTASETYSARKSRVGGRRALTRVLDLAVLLDTSAVDGRDACACEPCHAALLLATAVADGLGASLLFAPGGVRARDLLARVGAGPLDLHRGGSAHGSDGNGRALARLTARGGDALGGRRPHDGGSGVLGRAPVALYLARGCGLRGGLATHGARSLGGSAGGVGSHRGLRATGEALHLAHRAADRGRVDVDDEGGARHGQRSAIGRGSSPKRLIRPRSAAARSRATSPRSWSSSASRAAQPRSAGHAAA